MAWLLTNLIKIIAIIIGVLPRFLQIAIGTFLGDVWFYVVPFRRKIALANIKKAFPDWSDAKVWTTCRKNFENYGCGFIELLLLPVLDDKLASKLLIFEGREYIEQAEEAGKGFFLLSLHMGNWELMSASRTVLGINLSIISKKMKASVINEVWVKMRVANGVKIISEEKSTFDILRTIRRNEGIGFILDQFLGPPVGCKVKFFGHETGAPAGLALFVDRTRAPVLPVYNIRQGDGRIKVIVEKPVPFMEQGSIDKNISFMTQVYTSKIEDIVRKYPEQWLWLHRRWKPFRE
jgi:Kdo2-lipid IVA lauroyltransferase/acyltransferase